VKKILSFILIASLSVSFFCADMSVSAKELTVTTGANSGAGSLRGLLAIAESGDTVTIDPSVSEINLSCELTIDKEITIEASSGVTVIADNCRAFNNTSSSLLTLKNITVTKGLANTGGALYSFGDIKLINCMFIENQASYGGAVYTEGYADILNSSFFNNAAAYGSAVTALDFALIINSSFISNICTAEGGAIEAGGAGPLTSDIYMFNSTVDRNTGYGIYLNSQKSGAGYIYNSIFTSNSLGTCNTPVLGGVNLVDGENGITHDSVFGVNTVRRDDGYLPVLEDGNARNTASLITDLSGLPEMGLSFESYIFEFLLYDKLGNERQDPHNFGAVEVSVTDEVIYPTSLYLGVNNDLGYVTNFESGSTVSDIFDLLTLPLHGRIEIYNSDSSQALQADKLKTGMTIDYYYNKIKVKTYKIAVFGDVTGDGKVLINDLIIAAKHILTPSLLQDEFLQAALVLDEDEVNALSLVNIKKIILNIK